MLLHVYFDAYLWKIVNFLHQVKLVCLLGGRSISTALSSFGISNQSKSLVVAIFDAQPDAMAQVISNIQGTSVPVSRLGMFARG